MLHQILNKSINVEPGFGTFLKSSSRPWQFRDVPTLRGICVDAEGDMRRSEGDLRRVEEDPHRAGLRMRGMCVGLKRVGSGLDDA